MKTWAIGHPVFIAPNGAQGAWGRNVSFRPQAFEFWGLASLDPRHPPQQNRETGSRPKPEIASRFH
jgi:hypothetical protein